MFIIQLLSVLLAFSAIMLCHFFASRKQDNKANLKFLKTFSLIIAAVFFFRYMLGDDAIRYVYALGNSPIPSKFFTAVSIIVNWLIVSAIILVALYPFFKSERLTVLVKYYGLICATLYFAFLHYATIGIIGQGAYDTFSVRAVLMGIEAGLMLSYTFLVFAKNNFFKIKKQNKKVLWYIIGLVFASMPVYALSSLYGYINYTIKILDLTPYHRMLLYLAALLPLAIFLVLRNKDMRTKKFALLYISLATMITFTVSNKFESYLNVTNWPLHLCNTAMFLIPLVLIFNWKKLFYFTYLINVLGAFLAMAAPNYAESANLFSSTLIRFYVNHYIAFFMPLLIVSLKLYPRPRLKEFKYSMIGFGIYYLIVLVFNSWFSNYGTVDFFFINSDFIADKLGTWATNLLNVIWSFNIGNLTFTFYPLYQLIFFLGYVALGAGVWFVYEAGYTFADTLKDINNRKQTLKSDQLALEFALNGRSKEEPMNPETTNKIVLRNFSKRYAKSNVYAVKDANMEIVGGEIFGFLGHNGAGKSTIIKSIVGIQPITSGSIEVCGYDVDKQPIQAKQNIGFVPDHYALYEKLTGREYINYIADLYQVSTQQRTERINKYVTLFELQGAFDNPIKTYSHGMKQKIAIIAALIHDPKVWILDEPLTGLDPHSIFQVKECMKQHAKAGNIVFFSSHIIDVVQQLCHRIAIIKKGQILTSKSLKEIEKQGTLEEFYLKKNKINVDTAKVENQKNIPAEKQTKKARG